jgi:hypothetical protein
VQDEPAGSFGILAVCFEDEVLNHRHKHEQPELQVGREYANQNSGRMISLSISRLQMGEVEKERDRYSPRCIPIQHCPRSTSTFLSAPSFPKYPSAHLPNRDRSRFLRTEFERPWGRLREVGSGSKMAGAGCPTQGRSPEVRMT